MADEEQSATSALPSFHGPANIPSDIEGDIHIPVVEDADEEFNTLDEPVSETLVSKVGMTTYTYLS